MTENEMKAAAYKQAIISVVKSFSNFSDSDFFIACLKVLFDDFATAEFWISEEKKEQEANNELED